MIKLSKTQKEIEGLAGKVPQLTERQKEWAKREIPIFRWVKGSDTELRCPECKGAVPIAQRSKKDGKSHKIDRTFRCPHCGAKVSISSYDDYDKHKSKPRNDTKQEHFFEVMNVVGEWQVTRLFYMRRHCYIRRENTEWEFYECCQAWNKPSTSTTYFRALPKKPMSSWLYNPYSLYGWQVEENADEGTFRQYASVRNTLMPRKPNGANFFETRHICPNPQILSEYKRVGITRCALQNTGISAMGWFKRYSENSILPMYETLLKAKEYNVLKGILDRSYRGEGLRNVYFSAWKIANRNGYKIRNVTEWLDMVSLLNDNGLDFRSPHYVCPKDLRGLHQRLLRIREKKLEEEELKRRMEANKDYIIRIAKYLDLDIHNDELHLVVLKDIYDFREEGKHMHHCVYRCRYYEHADSLIMSARDGKGKRWETIEVNLRDFSIVQSYGYGDRHTERHQEILDLVEKNMWQIRKRRMSA